MCSGCATSLLATEAAPQTTSETKPLAAVGGGRWAMGDGRWAMGDGRWAMGDDKLRALSGTKSGQSLSDSLSNLMGGIPRA